MSTMDLRRACLALLGFVQLSQCVFLRIYCDDVTLSHYAEVPLFESEILLNSDCYNSSKENFIYAFGSSGKPDSDLTVSLLREVVALKTYNVFLLNWEKEASALSTITPTSLNRFIKPISLVVIWVPNAFNIGTQLAKAFMRMSNNGFNLRKTSMLGLSLGSQIAGQAGRTLVGEGQQIGRIFGLDPSGHNIYGELMPSLDADAAKAVFCVHTDPGGYGIHKTLCDIDVMVNFKAFTQPDKDKQKQPGCPIGTFQKYATKGTCSHIRSFLLFVEGLQRPGSMVASRAGSFRAWESGLGNYSDTVTLSIDWDKTKSGLYFMETNPISPYGKGVAGSRPSSLVQQQLNN